jgi:uncharacterized protein YlzI (FlbEa/FlbD family)
MKLIEFKLENGSVFVNPDKIVSVSEKPDGKTEITTVNYNEFYILNQSLEDVLMDLRTYGGFLTYYKKTIN